MAQWRMFLYRPTNQWLQVVFGTSGEWQTSRGVTPWVRHAEDTAKAFRVDPADLEKWEGDGLAELLNLDIGAGRVPVLPEGYPVATSIRLAPPVVPGSRTKLEELEERIVGLENRGIV